MRQMLSLLAAICIVGVSGPTVAATGPTPNDYDRAIGLREEWMYLTRNVVEPAAWVDGTSRFYYRRTVEGGFQHIMHNAQTGESKLAFDHQRLARALGQASGQRYDPFRLPFDTQADAYFRVTADNGIEAGFGESDWSCTLSDYKCKQLERSSKGRPRAFGVVRDLAVPAENEPLKSPDGAWEAFVKNDNLVVRKTGDDQVIVLSDDGAPDNFYDPESIVWSPDSKKIAIFRVKPGFRREIHRTESSPTDQLHPRLLAELYPKPGDEVDIEQPVIFM